MIEIIQAQAIDFDTPQSETLKILKSFKSEFSRPEAPIGHIFNGSGAVFDTPSPWLSGEHSPCHGLTGYAVLHIAPDPIRTDHLSRDPQLVSTADQEQFDFENDSQENSCFGCKLEPKQSPGGHPEATGVWRLHNRQTLKLKVSGVDVTRAFSCEMLKSNSTTCDLADEFDQVFGQF